MNGEEYQNPFARPSSAPFTSQDINGDGLLELPVTTQLPALSPGAALDSTCYSVAWSRLLENGETRPVLHTLMNLSEGYWFRLPQQLVGKVSASGDADRRVVTYTQVVESDDGVQLLGSPLFAVRAFTRSAWDSRGVTSGYEQLAAQGDLVFGIQIFTEEPDALRAIQQVRRSFHVIAE